MASTPRHLLEAGDDLTAELGVRYVSEPELGSLVVDVEELRHMRHLWSEEGWGMVGVPRAAAAAGGTNGYGMGFLEDWAGPKTPGPA